MYVILVIPKQLAKLVVTNTCSPAPLNIHLYLSKLLGWLNALSKHDLADFHIYIYTNIGAKCCTHTYGIIYKQYISILIFYFSYNSYNITLMQQQNIRFSLSTSIKSGISARIAKSLLFSQYRDIQGINIQVLKALKLLIFKLCIAVHSHS